MGRADELRARGHVAITRLWCDLETVEYFQVLGSCAKYLTQTSVKVELLAELALSLSASSCCTMEDVVGWSMQWAKPQRIIKPTNKRLTKTPNGYQHLPFNKKPMSTPQKNRTGGTPKSDRRNCRTPGRQAPIHPKTNPRIVGVGAEFGARRQQLQIIAGCHSRAVRNEQCGWGWLRGGKTAAGQPIGTGATLTCCKLMSTALGEFAESGSLGLFFLLVAGLGSAHWPQRGGVGRPRCDAPHHPPSEGRPEGLGACGAVPGLVLGAHRGGGASGAWHLSRERLWTWSAWGSLAGWKDRP
ncbi:hypothetical protein B0T16DRAFT_234861 [Cercophora newfieldiana]|uniref:Uncharacterized protein n=1 Tax=Cercophora newfieldiana TaxID=92897 RepID=A0AA40CJ00_9PEZI|nr:hypothetical protein B0T16DRAFT_234861 [Cercophora newfieldiana]